MFKKISKWFGGKSDEELMKEPRRVPDDVKDIPDGDDRWIMSQEFAVAGDVKRRLYMAARQSISSGDGKPVWEMLRVSYDLEKDGVTYAEITTLRLPEIVMRHLQNFEERIANALIGRVFSEESKQFVPVPGSYPTYNKFANRHGFHFDDDGSLLRINRQEPLLVDTVMPKDALDKLFNAEAAKVPPLSSWEGLYTRIINKIPEADIEVVDDEKFNTLMRTVVEKLQSFSDYIQSPDHTMREKDIAIANMAEYHPLRMKEGRATKAEQHICNATILVSLLRTAHELYQKEFSSGGKVSLQTLGLVWKIGSVCSDIAKNRFAIRKSESKKIADIIGQGPDPFGPKLPCEKVQKKILPPVPEPPAPPAV